MKSSFIPDNLSRFLFSKSKMNFETETQQEMVQVTKESLQILMSQKSSLETENQLNNSIIESYRDDIDFLEQENSRLKAKCKALKWKLKYYEFVLGPAPKKEPENDE